MPLTLLATSRYDMPASFGPSVVPQRTVVSEAHALVLSGRTTRSAAEPLVPPHFTVPEEPTLTVSHMRYLDVDYLGGRSYNEVVVSLSATTVEAGERIDAALGLILWVDQPGALIAGREYMGLPKLLGRIPPLREDGEDALAFDCREYDSPLIEGRAFDMKRLDADRLDRLNTRAGEVRTFGWKYIPAPSAPTGGGDLDYPLVNVMRWTYRDAWTGRGAFRFLPAEARDAPLSAAAVNALASLPLNGEVRAFRGIGEAVIDRTATRRLKAG